MGRKDIDLSANLIPARGLKLQVWEALKNSGILSANLIPARGLKPLRRISHHFPYSLSANLIPARGLKQANAGHGSKQIRQTFR